MFAKLLRSVVIGLIVAGLLLAALPVLRSSNGLFAEKTENTSDETPVSYNKAVRRAAPAVVNIYNRNLNGAANVLSLGSGVIMNERGYIITNRHVIKDAQQITVVLQDGRRYVALLVGSDGLTDLAVLKIDPGNLPVIPTNKNRVAHVGDVVLAIGNPYNLGQTVTQGILSATGRISMSTTGRQTFLQTDASINRGNSGGALVNSLGELIGINTLTYDKITDGETPEGLGFAIPIELATKIMDKLIRDGRVIRGYFGIQGKEIIPLRSSNSGIDRLQGIIVTEITPNGPASSAGFQINDIIINVDNKPAVSVLETMDQVAEIRPGTEIPVIVLRDGKRITLKMTVGEFPEDNN
ncbi:outer membrane-stress sensor serine endopeptidase DegS [Serratia marcescens]|uniref:outer membrane-stress sensor serine endopeptidase DegS n=1 Tax=Serratia marcescens TaxID=615 RepID=UPI0013705CEC|nr:outer membrane-stress sensor serine endopeptidase DegS [Serratia marcescens]MXU21305.1 outer membrane-stress sensor serine endopeptidase DegS [Serratia marcescens]